MPAVPPSPLGWSKSAPEIDQPDGEGATGALLLLLLDSRSPAGAHNHSAGMESVVSAGLIRDAADVESFCRARLQTSGRVAAAFAAAACELWTDQRAAGVQHAAGAPDWTDLDAEFDARTPSAALRAASRQLGNGLRRMVAAMLPTFEPPWRATPHHPLVLGAAIGAAGGTPRLASRAAALATVSVPATAAVRLLGLDPFAVQAVLARLAAEIDAAPPHPADDRTGSCHQRGHRAEEGRWATVPAHGAPALDLLADHHLTTEVRLFAS